MNEDKSLADKAVSIKGKDYVLVKDRIAFFNDNYPDGSITTELLSKPDDARVVVKATVSRWMLNGTGIYVERQQFTGHSQAVVGEGMVNKTAALENAETSAVGRALAMMGIGVIESVASADEMRKAQDLKNMPIPLRNDEPFPSREVVREGLKPVPMTTKEDVKEEDFNWN